MTQAGIATRRTALAAWTVGAAALLSGCRTQVTTTGTYVAPSAAGGPVLARPRRVLVQDFTVDWRTIQLDQGVAARLQRQTSGGNPNVTRVQLARSVQDAISDGIVDDLLKAGMAAERAPLDAQPGPGDLLVTGQITRVSEGNRTRRVAIGFGAGASEVFANVQLLQGAPRGEPMLLQTYDAESNSGRAPGMGAGAAAGAASTAIGAAGHAYAEAGRTGVAAEGAELGDRVAHNLGVFFAQQGWIAEAQVPELQLQ
jgi:hypothetical protein